MKQSQLAWILNRMGDLQAQIGKPGEALRAYQQAEDILRKQDREHRGTFFEYVQIWLAESLERKGLVLSTLGKSADARLATREAVKIRRDRVAASPALIWYKSELAVCLSRQGQVERRAGQAADAVASYRETIALTGESPELKPRHHFTLACCHAQLASLANEAGSGLEPQGSSAEIKRAMAEFKLAIDSGYGCIASVRTESSLDILRTREDFQKLVKELEAKISKPPEDISPTMDRSK